MLRVVWVTAWVMLRGALFVIVANSWVYFSGRKRIVHSENVPKTPAVLVLGAGAAAGRVSEVLADRLETALDLYRNGRCKKLLLSGDHQSRYYDEVTAMRRYLAARGVPEGDMFLDHAGFDTYSSLIRARDVFGLHHVVVVTQKYHLPRALYVAQALGMDAYGVSADRRFYRAAVWHQTREWISRPKALLDVWIHRKPRFTGAPIDLNGDGTVTH